MRRIVPTLALVLFGCTTPSGKGHPSNSTKVVKVSIGGSVSGLVGHGLVLANSGADALTVSADGTFTFATTVATGSAYAVSVAQQPSSPTQVCVVGAGSGKAQAAVTDITVSCTTSAYHVGGSVVGVVGSGLVLRDNGGDNFTVTSDGAFQFATPVASAKTYSVSIATQPTSPSQTCTVSGGSGTIAASDVTGVVVNCTANRYTVGGTVSGLAGTGLVLKNEGGDSLGVANDGSFAFSTPVASGSAYAVTVATQPSGPTQTCTVAQDTGSVGGGNVTSVAVTCTTNSYQVGGSVSGVVGAGLVLQDNLGDNLPVSADGVFTFATAVASSASFAVSVLAQPTSPSQTCTVTQHGSGIIGGAAVTDVAVSCATNTYTIGGTVTGLGGHGLVLQDNGGDDLAISGDGQFQFATAVASGSDFTVTIATQPNAPAQSCVVSGGHGTVGGGTVATVTVSCANAYTIGGTIAGLGAHGLAVALNGGDSVVITANGTWALPTTLADGAAYAVTVVAQPTLPAQTCTINNPSGTVAAANVVNVQITCDSTPFLVGGNVSGLVGSGLVLQDNGGDDLAVTGNGAFQFATWVYGAYGVTVATQPSSPAQTCVVGNASGSVSTAAISNVSVTCTTNHYNVGGTISGLAGTIVLQNNSDVLTLNGATSFTFANPVAAGGSYAVSVVAQPNSPEQTCTVSNGSGPVVASDIGDVSISCVANPYAVHVHVSGLVGAGLVLQDNGGDDLPVSADGRYTFATQIASGGAYSVAASQQPAGQTCVVSGGSGSVGNGDVDTVIVNCDSNAYVVGGSVSGLAGHGLVLQDNGGDDLPVNANGSFFFATTVASGSGYAVTVKTQPTNAWQTCTVSNGSGVVGSSDVGNVVVSCAATPYHVNVTASGVAGGGLVLENNGGDDLAVGSDGSYGFATTVASGSAYSVSVLAQPTSPWQTCQVSAGGGVVAGADVQVSVTCTTDTHTIGGTVVALDAGGLLLRDNGGNDLSIAASGSFVFTSPVASGSAYAVTIATQPTGQYCLVRRGSGTVGGSDVGNIVVTCAHLTNGSFETGDYSAWTISVVHINDFSLGQPDDYDFGTWALLASGTTVASGSSLYDQFTHTDIIENTFDNTYYASDGNYVAVGMENGGEDHRLYQDVIVPLDATSLCWDMAYRDSNLVTGILDDNQYIAVNLRDVDTDAIIATLYKTAGGVDPETVSTMTKYVQDISAYRGRLVRIDFEIYATEGFLDTALDHINFE